MTIEIKKRKNETVIKVAGIIDDVTSQALEKTVIERVKASPNITIDLKGTKEISDVGLSIRRRVKEVGSLKLTGVCESDTRRICQSIMLEMVKC